ncbi:ribonuclease H-like domain-containing protein [Tanacetum coccineum]
MAHQTIEEYMAQTNDDYGLGIVWPYFKNTVVFKLKGQFLKKLCENTLSGKESEDAYEHVKKVLKIIDLFHEPSIAEDLLMSCVFSKSFTGQARRWLKTILTRSITMWTGLREKFLIKHFPNTRKTI